MIKWGRPAYGQTNCFRALGNSYEKRKHAQKTCLYRVKGKMKIYEIQTRAPQLIEELMSVWESSVRATHLFLSDAEVKSIKEYVPRALENVEHLIVAESKKSVAFMGIQRERLEMLFAAPEERGKGIGKQLLKHGIRNYGITEVTVNEQNPQAVGFYEHMGFKPTSELIWMKKAHPIRFCI